MKRGRGLFKGYLALVVLALSCITINIGADKVQAATTDTEYTAILNIGADGANTSPTIGWMSGANGYLWDRVKSVTGDFNGDGKKDVAMMYNYGGSTTAIWTFISDGQNYVPKKAWESRPGNFSWENSKLVTGDFNHDGKDDVLVLYDYGDNTSGIWAFMSDGQLLTPKLVWKSGPRNFSWNSSKLVGGDFNGDGFGDVAVLYDYGNNTSGIWTFISNGGICPPKLAWQSKPGNYSWTQSSSVSSGDYNGDGKTDVAVLYDYGNSTTAMWVFSSNGSSLMPGRAWQSSPGNFSASASKLASGDYNQDGKTDLSVLYNYGNNKVGVWNFTSNGSSVTPKMTWQSAAGEYDWSRCLYSSSDVDGDKKSEFQIVYKYIFVPTIEKANFSTDGQNDILNIETSGIVTFNHSVDITNKVINLTTNAKVDNSGTINVPAGMKYVKSITKVPGQGIKITLNSGAFYKITQKNNLIQLTIESADIKDKVIVLDPGHGGTDPGAIGPAGTKEAVVNLQVGLKLRDALTALGAKVIMTRTTDVSLTPGAVDAGELQARINVGYVNNADVFLSIHHDSFSTSSSGTSVYISADNGNGSAQQSELLGNIMQENLVNALGLPNRGVQECRFYVTRNNQLAAALAELAFISNPDEEAKIISDDFQTKAAQAMAQSFSKFFNYFN